MKKVKKRSAKRKSDRIPKYYLSATFKEPTTIMNNLVYGGLKSSKEKSRKENLGIQTNQRIGPLVALIYPILLHASINFASFCGH